MIRQKRSIYFNGNKKVRAGGIDFEYTQEQINEIYKCTHDIEYFCETYCKIINIDRGLVNFELYDYQKRLINHYQIHDHSIVLAPRQCGKTITTAAYLLHYTMFNAYKNIAILANKGRTARAVLKKIQLIYENLPMWLKMGVTEYNKGSIEFENGSYLFCDSTTASSIRGDSISLLYIDETAFILPTLWYDFYTSVYPTISSSKTAKIIFSSTPKGMNHFYQLWTLAESGSSNFEPFNIEWFEPPGRDEAFKLKTIEDLGGKGIGERKWRQEYECNFLGSDGTLIIGSFLEKMNFKNPLEIRNNDSFYIFEYPQKNTHYMCISDVAEGLEQDSSTIQVVKVDLKRHKYIQVARYKNNTIKTHKFPMVINQIGRFYNNALVIVEANTYGREVLNKLHYDLEYPYIFYGKVDFGLKMTRATKPIGNAYMKDYIESKKFEIVDFETISEFSSYVKQSNDTYAADDNKHDDLVTPFVLLSYFISKKDLVEQWLDLSEEQTNKMTYEEKMNEDLIPTGFMCNGDEEINMNPYSNDNDIWGMHS